MAAAGCQLLETTTARASMLYNAFAHVGYFYKLIKRVTAYLQSNKVDLVIVCDSPAFNFHIAKAAKKAGVKTLFYVAPQLWSWAGWRIRKMRKCCDKLCCILPFEQDWFAQRGVDTTFVGNPILDELTPPLASYRKKYLDFRPENAHFAILPGSRSAEMKTLWLPMQRIALRLKGRFRNAAFTVAAVDADREKQLRMAQMLGFKCKYTVGSVSQTARAADFAIVASGSATLQVAAAGCPMVIMYQSSKILWLLLSWWLITTKYLSLVNILANKELVPEFMPNFGSIEPIVETIEQLVKDKDKLAQISGELIELAEPLTRKKACKETANIALGMLG